MADSGLNRGRDSGSWSAPGSRWRILTWSLPRGPSVRPWIRAGAV